MIKIIDMCKSYGKEKILKNINFVISNNEMIAIMGKSGSGKTTLLNVISLMTPYDCGRYYFNGNLLDKNINPLAFRRKNIGYILQNSIMLTDRNVYQNMWLGVDFLNVSFAEKKKIIYDVSQQLEIEKMLFKYPQDLSGGERQKVAIARTILKKSPLIIADEPTGSLDSKSADEIMSIFRRLNDNGCTILIVTHDLDVANKCNKIYEMKDGILF